MADRDYRALAAIFAGGALGSLTRAALNTPLCDDIWKVWPLTVKI